MVVTRGSDATKRLKPNQLLFLRTGKCRGETKSNVNTSRHISLETLKARIPFEKCCDSPGQKPIERQATETQDRKQAPEEEKLQSNSSQGRIDKLGQEG